MRSRRIYGAIFGLLLSVTAQASSSVGHKGVAAPALQTNSVVQLSLSGLSQENPKDLVSALRLVMILTVLSLAPAVLIMMTSFTRIVVVLSFLRQALGASRQHLFAQYLTEAGCIGLAGGLLGLLLAWLGLQGVTLLYGDSMKGLAELDWVMVLLAMGLALLSSLLAGLYPTWRACTVQPSQQLKSQ